MLYLNFPRFKQRRLITRMLFRRIVVLLFHIYQLRINAKPFPKPIVFEKKKKRSFCTVLEK